MLKRGVNTLKTPADKKLRKLQRKTSLSVPSASLDHRNAPSGCKKALKAKCGRFLPILGENPIGVNKKPGFPQGDVGKRMKFLTASGVGGTMDAGRGGKHRARCIEHRARGKKTMKNEKLAMQI